MTVVPWLLAISMAQQLPTIPPSALPADLLTLCADCEPRAKHPVRASAEFATSLAVPYIYNRYISGAEWSKVTFATIWQNMRSNVVWDDNNFQTNQIGHPLHGAFYFNALRSNGYNFWTSSLAAGAGAYLWEIAAETYPPSANDLLNTTLGGMVLGEMMWRLSNLVLDNTATGSGRVWREIAGFVLSPWNGVNRVTDGRSRTVAPNPTEWRPPMAQGFLDVGARLLGTQGNSIDVVESPARNPSINFRFVYGRPVADLVGKPFSTFTIGTELVVGSGRQALQFLNVEGNLGGSVIREGPTARHVFAVTMNYDYSFLPNSDTLPSAVIFNYGAQSFTAGVHSAFQLWPKWQLTTSLAAQGVALAAVRSDYYNIIDPGESEVDRNYDFGPGVGGRVSAILTRPGKALFTLNAGSIWIRTLDGSKYNHYITTASVDARYFILDQMGVGLSYSYLRRDSEPLDPATAPGPATRLEIPILRLFLSTAIPTW
jgi:Domain of unknown function (DUF3943)